MTFKSNRVELQNYLKADPRYNVSIREIIIRLDQTNQKHNIKTAANLVVALACPTINNQAHTQVQ